MGREAATDASPLDDVALPERGAMGLRTDPWRAALAAAAAGLASYGIVDSGWLQGLPACGVFLALLVLAPTHRSLTRRLAVNVALFLGWTQVLWWVQWPMNVNHAGVAIGLGVAASVGAVLRGARVVPECTRGEVAMLIAAPLAAGAAVSRWLLSSSPREALQGMLPGVDNWAHFAMFLSLRRYGAVPEALGQGGDGSGWGYGSNYPKGFHAAVASLSEILAPRIGSGPDALPLYLHGQALVVMLGLLMVTASLLGMPGLSGRPWVALPALVLTSTALLWEPGQHVFADGFAAFWLGAVAAGASVLIAVARSRPTLVEVAAVAGLLMLACHCWLPLVVFAAPAGLLVLLPYVGSRWSPRSSVPVLAILAIGALGSLKAVVVLFGAIPIGALVNQDGGYDAPALLPIAVLVLVGCEALRLLGSSRVQHLDRPPLGVPQVRLLLLTPLLGLMLVLSLFVVQVSRNGHTTYYFVKLLLGYGLVLSIVVPAVVAVLVATLLRPSPRSAPRMVASVVLALVATVAFGVVPPANAALFDDSAPGTAMVSTPYSRTAMADGLLAAAGATSDPASFDTVYVALGPARAGELFYPDVWFHALHASVSSRVLARMSAMQVQVTTPHEAAAVLTTLFEAEPELKVLVSAQEAPALVAALPARWAARVVPITTAPAG